MITTEKRHYKKKNAIILEGGGMKGLYYIGVLKALEESNNIYNINKFIGVSVGSIFATMMALGISAEKLEQIVKKTNFEKLLKPNNAFVSFFKFLFGWGLNTTSPLEKWVRKLINENFTFKKDPTQLDIYLYLKKNIIVSASNVNTRHYEIFELNNDIPLYKLITASCSIPIWFKPYKINKNYYVDGGMLLNYNILPLNHTDRYMGFRLDSKKDIQIFNNKFNSKISKLKHYLYSIYYLFVNKEDIILSDEWRLNTCFIETKILTLQTDLSNKEIDDVIKDGYEATLSYIIE